MTNGTDGKHVLVIDRQEHWRDLSVRSLSEAGFVVQALDRYEYPPSDPDSMSRRPDLIILGCTSVGGEELQLIERILDRKQRLLVFCTSLPWRTMRLLFLSGAEDVTHRTSQPDHLISIVKAALEQPTSLEYHGRSEQESDK